MQSKTTGTEDETKEPVPAPARTRKKKPETVVDYKAAVLEDFSDEFDVTALFSAVSDDFRLAQFFSFNELRELSRRLGVSAPSRWRRYHARYMREVMRPAMQDPTWKPPLCCEETFEGRRWHVLNAGGAIKVYVATNTFQRHYPVGARCVVEAMELLEEKYKVDFVASKDGEVPDLVIRMERLDGRGGRLGVTTTYVKPESDEIDLGKDEFVSAEVLLDTSESWSKEYIKTVLIHELLHALGLPHAPVSTKGDIMLPYYAGPRVELGPWTHAEMVRRYGAREDTQQDEIH